MEEESNGNLNLKINQEVTLWSRKSDQHDDWDDAVVTIPAPAIR